MRDYLAPHHRDHPSTGCPSAALLDEIGRCDDAVRDSYTEGMQSIVDVIATHLSPHDPSAARTTALGLFTVLVATMQLARAVSDRELSDDFSNQAFAMHRSCWTVGLSVRLEMPSRQRESAALRDMAVRSAGTWLAFLL